MPDPEVAALLKQSRTLVSKAFQLSTQVNETVDELAAYRGRMATRQADRQPYDGEERRRE